MRKIKFRGKSRKSGEWFYGNLYDKDTKGNTHVGTTQCGCLNIDPDSVGQFTGLKDKDRKEIYEGDIIAVCGKYPKVVKWIDDYAAFCTANIDDLHSPITARAGEKYAYGIPAPGWWTDFANEIEVIGNIHDNPELLEQP